MTPRRILLAVWDFIVGDDWRLALAAVVAIGLTAIVCALGVSAWWLAPLVALGALRLVPSPRTGPRVWRPPAAVTLGGQASSTNS